MGQDSIIILSHIILSILLFFLVNWLGNHSISKGYINLSISYRNDGAPAFNFLIRSLTPIVYLLIISSALYALNLDLIVKRIWMVIVYYFAIRILYNVLLNRSRLLNWWYQIFISSFTIAVAYFAYDKFIKDRNTLLPDFSSMNNEIWIIIFLFIYATLNNIQIPSAHSRNRKSKYIEYYYNLLSRRYSDIGNKISNPELAPLVYAIMIYENFNRPPIARVFENALFHMGCSKTLGIMQVTTDKYISNSESIELAINKINVDYAESLSESRKAQEKYGWQKDWSEERKEAWAKDDALRKTVNRYNPSHEYVVEVMNIHHDIVSKFYKDLLMLTN